MTSRPLSPHVGIYRWQITNTLSILHRLTGIALSIGAFFMVAWLWAAAYNGEYFEMWQSFFVSPLGIFMLVGWTAAFYYHLGNGIRHLFWDAGKGFALPNVTRSGVCVVLFAILSTALSWWYIYSQMKGCLHE